MLNRQTHVLLIAAGVAYLIFLFSACLIDSHKTFPPWPPGHPLRLLDMQKMVERSLPSGGVAWIARVPKFSEFEDSNPTDQKSPVLLYENDKPLGPPHSSHYDIESVGLGRYAHSKTIGGFVFSTSDNSDPNTNGRAYWVAMPP